MFEHLRALCRGGKDKTLRQMNVSECLYLARKRTGRGGIKDVVSHNFVSRFANTAPGHLSLHEKFR